MWLIESYEKDFNMYKAQGWMREHWAQSIAYAILYLLCVRIVHAAMEHRPALNLRIPLLIWNIFLALFSILGFVRMVPEFLDSVFNRGFNFSICNSRYALESPGFWAWMFAWSKLWELGDTLFVLLRKQHLYFLHYYHHATVLVYTWYAFAERTASGRWFCVMNYGIHALMYSYYACKSIRLSLPRFLSKFLTMLQILQMVIGLYINYVVYQIKKEEKFCQQSKENAIAAMLIYGSYLILFVHYFYNHYMIATTLKVTDHNDRRSNHYKVEFIGKKSR